MRLIDIDKACLVEFSSPRKPRYVVLSHRWTKHEVAFGDVGALGFPSTASPIKLRGMLQQAKRDGLHHAWIDTCCINKTSSVGLSEAINSMFRWYQDAESCYVYLHDVSKDNWQELFPKSRWFTRGWTLQELLAPRTVVFYDREWQVLGDRVTLADRVSRITGIAAETLETTDLGRYSVAQKMAWAARRVTTRPEDRAYCLMGLFGVNMPLLYGEGEKAFLRLQEEIIKYNDDHSIFAWSMGKKLKFSGLLAPRPDCFVHSQKMVSDLLSERHTYLVYLDCVEETHVYGRPSRVGVGIFLRRLSEDDQFARMNWKRKGLWFDTDTTGLWLDRPFQNRRLFVRELLNPRHHEDCLKGRVYGFKFSSAGLPPSTRISSVCISINRRVATLPPGRWGCVMVIDMPAEYEGLRRIALGFEFELNPVCLLEDSFSGTKQVGATSDHLYDWPSVLADDMAWDEIIEGSRVYRKKIHDGQRALRGHRPHGLDVLLSEHFTDRESLVAVKLDETGSPLLWEFDIDDLIGPFRNHHHEALKSTFGSRRNFQEAYGFGITDDGLKQEDDLLRALLSTMDLS